MTEERRHQLAEIARRKKLFREVRPQAPVAGRSVIVTDDGIATGSTMIAALQAVKTQNPREVIVAVPVASPDRLAEVGRWCDDAVCLLSPGRVLGNRAVLRGLHAGRGRGGGPAPPRVLPGARGCLAGGMTSLQGHVDGSDGMIRKRWEHFAHDADIGVRGIGASKAEAFEQAAMALTAVILDPQELAAEEVIEITCEAPDDELLLVDWLNALVYEMATRRLLFGRFEVHIDGHRLHGQGVGRADRRGQAPTGRRGQRRDPDRAFGSGKRPTAPGSPSALSMCRHSDAGDCHGHELADAQIAHSSGGSSRSARCACRRSSMPARS